jgi:hypothetical protein
MMKAFLYPKIIRSGYFYKCPKYCNIGRKEKLSLGDNCLWAFSSAIHICVDMFLFVPIFGCQALCMR